MDAEPKDVRLPVMVTRTEAEAIDAWRYANRVPTRAEAIRRLIEAGLKADPAASAGTPGFAATIGVALDRLPETVGANPDNTSAGDEARSEPVAAER